ncbi:PilW family protein [Roseateles sp. BYS180W]|uniref:PilW family protein n=1 Tax=Roseateles rivi TaxID=3299028 RepID=A0ABW7FU24_9BURK
MKQPPISIPLMQRGVTLVELMVAMVLALVVALVIAQAGTMWEGTKRSTTALGSGTVSAALALTAIQRDIGQSGYGVMMSGAAGCWAQAQARNGDIERFQLAPILITRGDNGSPDRIRILVTDTTNFATPMGTAQDHHSDDSVFHMQEGVSFGARRGDLMLAVPKSGCSSDLEFPTSDAITATVFNLSEAPSEGKLTHEEGDFGPWNHNGKDTLFPDINGKGLNYEAGHHIYNLGRPESRLGVPLYREYYLANDADGIPTRLVMRTVTATGSVASASVAAGGNNLSVAKITSRVDQLATNVVQLAAVYGRDTSDPPDGIVDEWDSDRPNTARGWQRVLAVRLAVVVRSNKPEKEEVTDGKPSTGGGDCTGALSTTNYPTWKPNGVDTRCLNLAGVPDFRRYRYQVYETTIPMRNVLWQN